MYESDKRAIIAFQQHFEHLTYLAVMNATRECARGEGREEESWRERSRKRNEAA
jgi:hypothetical protein